MGYIKHFLLVVVSGCLLFFTTKLHADTTESLGSLKDNIDLCSAAEIGDLEVVEALLRKPNNHVNRKDTHGWMPLHHAVAKNHLKVVNRLLKEPNIDLNAGVEMWFFRACEFYGVTPLHIAAYNGYVEVVKMLLAHPNINVNAETTDWSGYTPLHFAAERRHLEIVKILLQNRNINVNANKSGNTPLYHALNGSRKITMGGEDFVTTEEIVATMKILLAHSDIDVRIKDNSGNTLLHVAALENDVAPINLLLAHGGIDMNTKNNNGDTPLDVACHYSSLKSINIMNALLNAGGTRTNRKKDSQNRSELHWAVIGGKVEKVKKVLKKPGIQVNSLDSEYCTPLHYAAQLGNEAIVKVLLDASGILANEKTKYQNYTPLHIAAKKGHIAIVKLLLNVPDVLINQETEDGDYCPSSGNW